MKTTLLFLCLLIIPAAGPLEARTPLHIESIEVSGNSRTSLETILKYLPLREGDRVEPDSIVVAVNVLRRADLFDSVEFSSRRGVKRG